MGFELHVAEGASIAIRAKKKRGAPVTMNPLRSWTDDEATRYFVLEKPV